jgi:UDP-2,4-diacetamido-2,4,6-trideoxy-beta-L-altropyranose hydrolase
MQTKRKIYFRADGSPQIGLGHITRSLALADMLKNDFEIIVVIQQPTEAVKQQILEVTAAIVALPQTTLYTAEAHWLAQNYLKNEDIVVLDGYNFQTDYQAVIKDTGAKLVCIDDIFSYHFLADVIINHSGGITPAQYRAESYTKFCLGLDYALLRKPFLEAAQQARKIEKIHKVFICFGGSDSSNFTEQVLQVCIASQLFEQLYVVVGSAYVHERSLEILASEHKNVFLYKNLDASRLCAVMQQCELAIVPASSIAYECLAVGLCLVVGYYVENQYNFHKYFTEMSIKTVGDYNQGGVEAVANFLKDFHTKPITNYTVRLSDDMLKMTFNELK